MSRIAPAFRSHTQTERPLAGDEVVYACTSQPPELPDSPIVDAHAHVFAASSLPVEGFLYQSQQVPRWLTVVVITRDVVVVLGYFILFMMTQETMEVRPTVSGKLSTFCQLGSVASVLIRLVFPGGVPPLVEHGFFYAAGVLTTVAGLQYVYRGMVWAQVRGDA